MNIKSSWVNILLLLPCLTQFTMATSSTPAPSASPTPVIRLVGPAENLGRVEVLRSNKWGTVCEDRWSMNDGDVACRMLGFERAVQIFKSSTFGGGNGTIWLTKLVCNGTEASLFDCKNALEYLGNTGCTHQKDAGVECLREGFYSCPAQILTEEGSFHSPKYPEDYPTNAECRWIITIPQELEDQDLSINLTFTVFQLEFDSACSFDQVTVYDVKERDSKMLGRFCGGIPPPLYSNSGQMVVKLFSDYSMTFKGFNATFKFTSALVPANILFITSGQSVVRQGHVKLNCWSKGVPTPDVAWMRNGKVLVRGERTAILELYNVTLDDEDLYTCIANNSEGIDYANTTVNVVECPTSCICISKTDELIIDCKASNITSVPSTIPMSVTEMDFSNNNIGTLDTDDLQSLGKLQKLYLSNNDIERLRSGTFQDTGALKEIFLARNKISVLEKGSFSGLESSLVILFLSNNRLTNLTSGVFTNLTSLQYLFLSNNDIKTVDSLSFMGLTSLILIHLADNPITTLKAKAFSINDSKLQTIYLMNTEVEKLNLRAFDGHKEVKTYISPDNVDDGVFTNQKGLFIALTEAGFAGGNDSYRAPCPTGTFVPHLEHFSYETALEAECIQCPPGGFYSERVAHVDESCFTCNPGTYVPPERAPGKKVLDCHVCPTGTKTNLHSGYRACRCIEGFHRRNRFGQCGSCPSKGLDCVNESVSLKKGYYWQWDTEEHMLAYKAFADNLKIENDSYSRNTSYFNETLPPPYQCPRVESCVGGLESKCATGYSGPLCEVCQSGYYKRVLACKACPSGTWVIVQLGLVGLVVLILVAILIWNGRRKKTKQRRAMIDILLARLKIVIGFYQVTSGIVEAFVYVKWPSSLSMIGDYAEVIQLNILQFVPLHCLFPSWKQNAFSNMYVIMGSNIFIIMFAFVVYWIRKLFLLRKRSKDSASKIRNTLSTTKEFLYRNVFLFIFITYPSTCSAILRTLPLACHKLCTENSCTYYLKADYSVKCEGETYEFFKLFAFAASSYIVLLPALVLVALWRRRRQQLAASAQQDEDKVISNTVDSEFGVYPETAEVAEENGEEEEEEADANAEGPGDESELISGMSFLYENYKDDAWYWELVEVVRKLVLTCGIILIGRESRAYVGLASICSGLFAIAYAFRKPIKDEFEDKLQLTSLLVIFLNLGIGVILKIPKEAIPSDVDEHVDSLLVNILVVGANVLVILLVVGRYLAVLIHNFLLWRRNPQCSASCCITMLLSLNELGSGVNSVASGGGRSLKVQMGIGRVDMPSMKGAVSDNVAFEIEENSEDDATREKNKDKILKTVRLMSTNERSNEMEIYNRAGKTDSDGRRFTRFPSFKARDVDSCEHSRM